MGEFVEWMFRTPLSRASLLVVLILAIAVGGLMADALGWRRWGTRLALFGLGFALIPTFVSRVGFYDFAPSIRAINDCLGGITRSWTGPEELLNLMLLVPFGIGLTWASRSLVLGTSGTTALAIAIELGQSFTGLGACERGDMVRNTVGGLLAAGFTFLLMPRPDPAPVQPAPPREDDAPAPGPGRRW